MTHTDIAIVGGGPVGLFLGCLLLQKGVSCCVLEARSEPSTHSRSIGIHPPALERLASTGIADELIRDGVVVREGLAYSNTVLLGALRFEACPPPYRFVLAIPQYRTEAVLEKRLAGLDGGALVRGATVENVREDASGVELDVRIAGAISQVRALYVAGCDGPGSVVRSGSGIGFPGAAYGDTYVMGDFPDRTDFGSRAAIYLTDEGVVESFPLPGNIRRWVVGTGSRTVEAHPAVLEELVAARTGRPIDAEGCTMISSFPVSCHMATAMARRRVLLVGDAAHVISPIGGQGMNLGWLDAWFAAAALAKAVRKEEAPDELFRSYDRTRRRAAATARRRSEFNMWMGRPGRGHSLKRAGIRIALATPASGYFARRFTMRGI